MWYNYTMNKNILIGVLVVVIVLLGGLFYKANTAKAPVETDVTVGTEFTTYANEQFGFSVDYPADFEMVDDSVVIAPNYEERIPATSFVRKIPIEYCDLSDLPEGCKPYTENPKIVVSVVGGSVDGLVAEWTELFGAPNVVLDGGRSFSMWSQGAEGEGMNYYFTELSADLTLLLAYRYLDENTLILYKEAPDFWSLDKQKEVFDQVLSSLKVN